MRAVMEIYLIRHTTPAVEPGICYGQTDLDVTAAFDSEAAEIGRRLPSTIARVVSSPLRRCSKLARFLFPSLEIELLDGLKEINCGDWEMKKWDELPEGTSRNRMSDYVHTPFPRGETYSQLQARGVAVFETVVRTGKDSAIVTHAGVIRGILAHVSGTPLNEAFDRFRLPYACVFRLRPDGSSAAWEQL